MPKKTKTTKKPVITRSLMPTSPFKRTAMLVAMFVVVAYGVYVVFNSLAATRGAFISTNDEIAHLELLNNFRRSKSLPVQSRSDCLSRAARDWAKAMGDSQKISHTDLRSWYPKYCGKITGIIRENVAYDQDPKSAFQQFVNSPHHYDNMVAGATAVGIGAYRDSSNTLWLVQAYASCNGCGGNWTKPFADVRAVISASLPLKVHPGDTITIRPGYRNISSGSVTRAYLEAPIPTGTTLVDGGGGSYSSASTPRDAGFYPHVVWSLGSVASKAGRDFSYTVKVNSDATTGSRLCFLTEFRSTNPSSGTHYTSQRCATVVRRTEVSGKVYNPTTGESYAGLNIATCSSAIATTGGDGIFRFSVDENSNYCVRVGSGGPQNLTGPIGLNNNPAHAGAISYESQKAGTFCSSCSDWDRDTDTGFDFKYSDTNAPSMPNGLISTSTTSTAANLQWNVSTDNVAVVGYRLYRKGSLPTDQYGIVSQPTTNSQADSGLSAATCYYYTVTAMDAAGNESAKSGSLQVCTPLL